MKTFQKSQEIFENKARLEFIYWQSPAFINL